MASVVRGLTLAQLTGPGAPDLQAGSIGRPTDFPALVVIFDGISGTVVGASEASIPASFLSLIDTPAQWGTVGQILKVNANATALEFVDDTMGAGGSSLTLTSPNGTQYLLKVTNEGSLETELIP